jgi:hypothetical protein
MPVDALALAAVFGGRMATRRPVKGLMPVNMHPL